eukprot:3479136-Prymnesium_polylepis.1
MDGSQQRHTSRLSRRSRVHASTHHAFMSRCPARTAARRLASSLADSLAAKNPTMPQASGRSPGWASPPQHRSLVHK